MSSMKGLASLVTSGDEEERLRATWRGILPWVVGFGVQLLAMIVVRIALRQLFDGSEVGSGAEMLINISFIGVASALGLVVATALGRRLDKRSLSEYGIGINKRWLSDWIVGIVIGGLTYAVPTAVFAQGGKAEITAISITNGDTLIIIALAAVIAIIAIGFQTAFEEFVFRGVMIKNFSEGLIARSLSQKLSVVVSLLFSSAIFGVSHIITQGGGGAEGRSLQLLITSTLLGLMWGGAYVLTGQLAIPFGLHFGHNLWSTLILQPEGLALTLPALGQVTYSISRYELALGKVIVGAVCVLIWVYFTSDALTGRKEIATEP